MNDFFARIYESWCQLYDSASPFVLLFDAFFEGKAYLQMGLAVLLLPLLLWALFYFFWQSPYGKIGHWILWLFVVAGVVGVVTYSLANNVIQTSGDIDLANELSNEEFQNYFTNLLLKYAFVNAGISFIVSLIYSLIIKQKSKMQIHLPF